jgi:phage terminase small subunit
MKTLFKDLPLTPKQQLFCDEYFKDFNATAAALRAGYSRATALNGQLMGMPKIIAHVKARMKKTRKKLNIDHQRIAAELAKIAFANMGDYFGDDGEAKPMHKLTDDQKAAIVNLKITEGKDGTTIQLRLSNKLQALEKLPKHTGFYHPEQQLPEQEFIYFDQQELDEHDRFEDDSLPPEGINGSAHGVGRDEQSAALSAKSGAQSEMNGAHGVESDEHGVLRSAHGVESEMSVALSAESGAQSIVNSALEVTGNELKMEGREQLVAGTAQKTEQGKAEEKPMGKYKRRALRKMGFL